jgi:hypothetical protein
MVYIFQTKNPNLDKFWSVLQWHMLVKFKAIRSTLLPFGTFYGRLVHFPILECWTKKNLATFLFSLSLFLSPKISVSFSFQKWNEIKMLGDEKQIGRAIAFVHILSEPLKKEIFTLTKKKVSVNRFAFRPTIHFLLHWSLGVGRACKSERTCSYGLKNIRIKLEEKLPSFTQIRAI